MIQTDPNGGSLKCRHRCAQQQILSKPFNCNIIHQRNCSAHKVHMLRIWSGKEAVFPLKIAEISRQREAKNCMDMDQDREMLEVYNLQLRTSVGSGKVSSDLLNKIFCLQYIYIFSPNISDKLVSITSFKASPLSLLDVSSSKERAAVAWLIVRYLVSGDGDIKCHSGESQLGAKPRH